MSNGEGEADDGHYQMISWILAKFHVDIYFNLCYYNVGGIIMAIYGTYNGSAIETNASYPIGQRFLLIPISGEKRINSHKQELIEKLYGSVPDSGITYEESKRERRERI